MNVLKQLFIDFNAYFASCEQHMRPELIGRPIAITPVATESGCCIAASYAAKARGVKVGTRVREARMLCPDVVIVEARPDQYVRLHHELNAIIEQCISVTQVCSVDEVRCELNGHWQEPDFAIGVAREIKARLVDFSPALRCSIGIAPNAYLAKTASEMQKPDGLVTLTGLEVPGKLIEYGMEMDDLCGIGHQMTTRLNNYGVYTIEHLYALSRDRMRAIWRGVEGERMWFRLRGYEVEQPPTKRSCFGHSHVLPPALRNEAKSHAVLSKLIQKAAFRLRREGYFCGCLGVQVQFYDAPTWQVNQGFDKTQSTQCLLEHFARLWEQRPSIKAPFAVSVNLTSLESTAQHTPTLWSGDREHREHRLDSAVDTLNRAYGSRALFRASAMEAIDSAPTRIPFSHVPQDDEW
ncbi:MAG: DNA polymerase [Verrucomicrobiota bacterium]|nr:DNA polymerase [Verrucomicrobiota bacterium]